MNEDAYRRQTVCVEATDALSVYLHLYLTHHMFSLKRGLMCDTSVLLFVDVVLYMI